MKIRSTSFVVLFYTLVCIGCKSEIPPPPNKKAYAMQKLIDSSIVASIALQQEYQSTLEEIGWDSILDVRHIASDRDFTKSLRMIDIARSTRAEYDRKEDSLREALVDNVQALRVPERTQADFYRALNGISQKALADSVRWVEKQINYITDFVFEFLWENKEKWLVEGDTLRFTDSEALHTFNSIMKESGSLPEEHRRHLAHANAKRAEDLKRLRGSLPK